MSLIERAQSELALINFGEDDSRVMVEILQRFFDQWDSGGAVHVAAPVLQRLIAGKPLSPLTGADEEWFDVSEMSGRPMWQNKRCSSVFKDGSGTSYTIDEPGHPAVSFPYWPDRADVPSPVIECEL